MVVHALREAVRARVDGRCANQQSVMFSSLGYKHGIPGDADFVYDVRSLPNPVWEHQLRDLTGHAPAVIAYLEGHTEVGALIADLTVFIAKRIAECAASNRGYLTIAIGCTGGQHRSVYVVECLAARFRQE